MTSLILHQGSAVLCAHGGFAFTRIPAERVRIAGQPVVTTASNYVVSGCARNTSEGPRCDRALFLNGASRVFSSGIPVLLESSTSISEPSVTPLVIQAAQMRVRAV